MALVILLMQCMHRTQSSGITFSSFDCFVPRQGIGRASVDHEAFHVKPVLHIVLDGLLDRSSGCPARCR